MTELRRFLNGVTLAALTVLTVIVFLHVYHLDKQLEKSAYHIVALLSDSELKRGMADLQERIASHLGPADRLRPTPTATVVKLAYDPPVLDNFGRSRTDSLVACGDLAPYGSASVSLRCAALILRKGASVSEAATAFDLAASLGMGDSLQSLYNHSAEATSIRRDAPPATQAIEFVYAVIPVGSSEVVVIYPGIVVEPGFDFRSRPWYRATRHIRGLLASNIYHDYASNDFVISISPDTSPSGRIRVLADYRMQPGGTGLDLYLLNAILAIVALTGYIRFYARSRFTYQRFLVASTALLVAEYIFLVVNQVLAASEAPHLSDKHMITYLLTFLPTGSLLAVSALSLGGTKRGPWLTFWTWYPFEVLAGFLDLWSGWLVFGAAFSCVCLCLFGWNLRKVGRSYGTNGASDLSPHPRSAAAYGSIAYFLWGLSQFFMVLLARESSYLWTFLAPIAARWTWTDLLFSDVGGFIVLLYAKGVAIFFTTLFLYSLELVALRRTFAAGEPMPSLHLDAAGSIVGYSDDFPRTFDKAPNKRRFVDLIAAHEDQAEFSHAFVNDLKLRSYICQVPELFGEALLSVTLDATDSRGRSRRVWLRRFDDLRLQTSVSREALGELIAYADALREKINATRADLGVFGDPAVAGKLMAEFTSLTSEISQIILERSRRELMTLAEGELVEEVKLNIERLWGLLSEEVTQFSTLYLGSRISLAYPLPDPSFESFPRRVRISAAVWRLTINSILHEIVRDRTDDSTQADRSVRLSLVPPEQGAAALEGCIVLRFETNSSEGLRDAVAAMRQDRLFVRQGQPGRSLLTVNRLLPAFDGALVSHESHDKLFLEVGIRPLYSSSGGATS